MKWTNVKDKHFVDIVKDESTGYFTWEENNHCPNNPFLVGLYVNNIVTGNVTFEYYLVVLGEDGLRVVNEDDSEYMVGWNISDIEYWCEVKNPYYER